MAKTAGLSQRLNPTGEGDVYGEPFLVFSNDAWLKNEDGISRFDLGRMRVTTKLRFKGKGYLSSIASNGSSFALTMHDGDVGSWALVESDAWVVEPTKLPQGDTSGSVYWDRTRKAYVLATHGNQGGANFFDILDKNGTPKERIVFDRSQDEQLPFEMISTQSFCPAGDEVIGYAGYAACRTTLKAGAKWKCTKGDELGRCPGSLNPVITKGRFYDEEGRTENVTPPGDLAQRFRAPSSVAYVTIGPKGLRPRLPFRNAEDNGPFATLFEIGDAWFSLRTISAEDAKKRGHQPEDELLIERFDAGGTKTAEAFVLKSYWIGDWITDVGDDLVLVSGDLKGSARFDKRTLVRRDPIPTLDAVRERLSRWGGASWTFEAGLAMTLALAGLVPLFALFWLIGRTSTPGGARAVWATRVMAVLVTFAVPTLLALVSRFYQR